jgi:hypothetical protein
MFQQTEFQVTLVSIVKSNERNKSAEFETALAKPIELKGSWEVGLMEMAYPHNWFNIKEDYYLGLLTMRSESEGVELVNTDETLKISKIEYKLHVEQILSNVQLRKAIHIRAGNYSATEFVENIEKQITSFTELVNTSFKLHKRTGRVVVNSPVKFTLIGFMRKSLLRLLGFSDLTVKLGQGQEPQQRLEYFTFASNTITFATKVPILKKYTVMMVYSDISDYSLVGDTQAPLLGYIPIASEYGEQAHLVFNPVYNVAVKENVLSHITIKICTDYGELYHLKTREKKFVA